MGYSNIKWDTSPKVPHITVAFTCWLYYLFELFTTEHHHHNQNIQVCSIPTEFDPYVYLQSNTRNDQQYLQNEVWRLPAMAVH